MSASLFELVYIDSEQICMCSENPVFDMLRDSKAPVSSGIGSPAPSTSADHDAASDRRGAIDRNLHVAPGGSRNERVNHTTVLGLREATINEAAGDGDTTSDNEVSMEHNSSPESSGTLPVDSIDRDALQEKLNDAQLKFERACQQIVLLDQKIKDLEVRYKRAVQRRQNSFRYNLRLKLSVYTGIKMMYHHYAGTKADELTVLHRQRHSTVRETSTSADTRHSS